MKQKIQHCDICDCPTGRCHEDRIECCHCGKILCEECSDEISKEAYCAECYNWWMENFGDGLRLICVK